MKINEHEIRSVSALEPFKRYQYLLKRIADWENVYSLESPDGGPALSELKGHRLYPLWPAPEFAQDAATGAWSAFGIVEISLNEFMKRVLPQIKNEGFLLNAFPVGDRTGFVVTPDEFVRDIDIELENYE